MQTEGEAASYDRPTAECDMVMKGGITSGVVYPLAACRLAQTYRFRQLGGASAGAIAAAFVAAAEHGRARGGFERLARLPAELGADLAGLFQPAPATAAAFDVLSALVAPGRGRGRKALTAVGVVARHGWALAAVVAAGALLVAAAVVAGAQAVAGGPVRLGVVAVVAAVWLPAAVAIGLAAAAARVARRTVAALPGHGFGLCDGHTRRPGSGPAPLTDWMAERLDETAGLAPGEGPLTFGHLWGEEAVAAQAEVSDRQGRGVRVLPEHVRAARDLRRVDLEVMTTCLTFRRPYRFPFGTRLFSFCEARLRGYFPERVVDHLVAHGEVCEDVVERDADGREHVVRMRCPCHGEPVRRLPAPADLPVVLAARISLSFPGLISAVPLLAVDWSRPVGKRSVVEVWFSDGGISSNFPVHLFDSFWPRRPTFGINLQPVHPDFPDQLVWRAAPGASGILPRAHAITGMGGFVHAVLDTMQNWVDATQLTLAGYRDRVVEVRQRPDEGGMNLSMPPETVEALSRRGAEAVALFDTFDFDLHRWIRYRVSMSELDEVLDGLRARYGSDGDRGGSYERFLAGYGPTARSYGTGSRVAAERDRQATAQLMEVADAWHRARHPSGAGKVPRPKPTVRIVPTQ
jgi:predicted acylesterase/phospholipase RssA